MRREGEGWTQRAGLRGGVARSIAMGVEGGVVFDVGATIVFIGLEEASVARCCVQEECTDGGMVNKVF